MKKLAIIVGVAAVTVILAIVLFVIRVAKKEIKEVKETSEEIIVTLFTFALTEDGPEEGILKDFFGLYAKLMSIPGVRKVELRDLENKLNPEIVIKLEPGIKKTPELISQVSDIMKQVEDYVLDID